MTHQTIECNTIEEARGYASSGGRYLVLDAATLQQIDDAEDAGAFEGGQTSNSDGAPFSATGQAGDAFNSADEPAPVEPVDLDGAWRAITIDEAIEHALGVRDVITTWLRNETGPLILVPTKVLNRWLGRPDVDDGA